MNNRRKLTILLSIGLILFIGITYLSTDSDILFYAMLAMLPLGVLQFFSAVMGAFRGSKVQGVYLAACVLFFVVVFLSAYGFIPGLRSDNEDFWLKMFFGVPYGMAIVYTLILVLEPVRKPKVNAGAPQDILDDENWDSL